MNIHGIESKIKKQIESQPVLLYMKGSPDFPMCGYSAQVAHILIESRAKFAYVNILEAPEIRSTLPKIANWPTFPQLYIDGELIGGCDIVVDLYQNDKIKLRLESVNAISESEFEATELL